MSQEMSRIHARGYHDGAAGGTVIGLPVIKNFAKPALREQILAEVLNGKKLVCLAISEAFAGSDVAGTKTFARKSADGTYWTVTGRESRFHNSLTSSYLLLSLRHQS
jgi:alkylation response protein AidB-like acyl-CoA dehydrogenase